MARSPETGTQDGWQSLQRLTPEGAVESEQRIRLDREVVAHTHAGARELGQRYWRQVEQSTFSLVRRNESDDGVSLNILGKRPVLLVFASAQTFVSDGDVTCRYAIRGGLLARWPHGALTLSQQRAPELALHSAITGFYPRLAARPGRPGWSRPLYALVQRRLHVWISRRFFRALVQGAQQ